MSYWPVLFTCFDVASRKYVTWYDDQYGTAYQRRFLHFGSSIFGIFVPRALSWVGMARAGKGKVAEGDFSLGADSDQLRLMERLNLPFLNIGGDELLPLVKGKSPGGQGGTPGNASSKNKRPMIDAHQDPNKKRFVWPDALHRDFLAAVFDIGLKYASPKEVAQLMAEDDNTVSMEQMKSHIQKFMMFRERKEGEYVPYSDQERGILPSRPSFASGGSYDASSLANGTSVSYTNNNQFGDMANNVIKGEVAWSESGSVAPSVSLRDTNKDARDKKPTTRQYQNSRPTTTIPPAVLLAKIDTMGEAINAQSAHLANIKQLIKRQTKLFVLLSQKAAQLKATLPNDVPNPLTYNAFLDNGVRNTCSTLYPMNIVTGDSTFGLSYIDTTQKNLYNDSFNYNYTNNATSNGEGVVNLNYLRHSATGNNTDNNTRSGFQVMSEMREHMDTHRKLLLRKEDQLSQHGYISDRYVHDDGCTSGYNRFTDQYKYKEYVYTDEDNRLCYPNGIKTDSKNSAYGITGMGRVDATNSQTRPITTVYPNQHYVSQTTGLTSGNSSVRSGKSGIDGTDTSNMLGYFYNISQATKAAHGSTVRSQATTQPNNQLQSGNNGNSVVSGGSANGSTNGHYSSATNSNVMVNNLSSASNGIAAMNGTTNGVTNGVTNGFYRASSESNTTAHVPPAYAFNYPVLPLPSNYTSTSTSATTMNNNISNPAEPADWDSELDLESDLFSFLFDPTQT